MSPMDNDTADINRRLEILKHGLWGALVALLLADVLGPDIITFPADVLRTGSGLRTEMGDVQIETLQQIEEEFAPVRARLAELSANFPSSEATP